MLELFTGRKSSDCTGLSRREFLRVGGLSALGLSLPAFLRLRQQAAAASTPGPPAEIRGEFGTIPTRHPGVRVCEHLPLLARQFDKLSLIRGHDPRNGSHGTSDHLMMSGHKFNPALAYPCYGSVVARERGYQRGLFPFVQLGR